MRHRVVGVGVERDHGHGQGRSPSTMWLVVGRYTARRRSGRGPPAFWRSGRRGGAAGRLDAIGGLQLSVAAGMGWLPGETGVVGGYAAAGRGRDRGRLGHGRGRGQRGENGTQDGVRLVPSGACRKAAASMSRRRADIVTPGGPWRHGRRPPRRRPSTPARDRPVAEEGPKRRWGCGTAAGV